MIVSICYVYGFLLFLIVLIIVIDLVKKIPDDVLENYGKNVKGLTCSRILESLSVSPKGKCNAVGFASSDCCENVLRQVLLKVYVFCVCVWFSIFLWFFFFFFFHQVIGVIVFVRSLLNRIMS